MKYEAVIGLEVHVQVRTRTKVFCGCSNGAGDEPNTNVCPVCLGYPGSLPVMNAEAIRKTIIAGMTCGCAIARYSKWDRKNYYYPDMPKNYQISQYDLPICEGGEIPIEGKGFSGKPLTPRNIKLTRIHLEEDVAKSTHLGKYSGIDYNRAGTPLMEIVSEPDMHTADEAYAYLTALKQAMQFAGISDCDMEKGQLRCDVNISVRPAGETKLGTKIELKNLNSFRAIHRSIDYEIDRQIDACEAGEPLYQETRRWDDDAGMTTVMRSKENAHDYRYFPDPDLMPVTVTDDQLDTIRADLPECPWSRRDRFVEQFGITPYDADVLTADKALADYFEAAAQGVKNAKTVANWIQTELLAVLGKEGKPITESPVSAGHLADLVALIEADTISGKIAKQVFAEMLISDKSPKEIVKEKGMEQVTDTGAIEGMVAAVIANNPKPVADYQAGNAKAIQSLVGQVMKASRGKANPQMVVQLLKAALD
ncbi:MAG: Asp-tRNA(Asn)/Glu-tRNA(Gln) amidotransferase subunit GatB [Lentisphaeria bacterium]|nr:Asp-tRNA(Asn)/Glu-tRNA(Gln) amidotransferase subunit GatB [Lentisphaeria bacterium]